MAKKTKPDESSELADARLVAARLARAIAEGRTPPQDVIAQGLEWWDDPATEPDAAA